MGGSDASKTVPEFRGVVWGTVEAGIQPGIRLIGAGRPVRNGAEITVRSYLRNATRGDLARVYTYRSAEIWDKEGAPIPFGDQGWAALGLPGATLVIIPAGETILIGEDQIQINPTLNAGVRRQAANHLSAGTNHIAQRFLYGIPGQYRPRGLEKDKLTEAEALKEASRIIDKDDPNYRTHVTLLTRDGKKISLARRNRSGVRIPGMEPDLRGCP